MKIFIIVTHYKTLKRKTKKKSICYSIKLEIKNVFNLVCKINVFNVVHAFQCQDLRKRKHFFCTLIYKLSINRFKKYRRDVEFKRYLRLYIFA